MTIVTSSADGDVTTLRIDDGKGNALAPAVMDEFEAALDQACGDGARAVVVRGRGRTFSAGLDLSSVQAPQPEKVAYLTRAARFLLDLWMAPVPILSAVEGHALAGGALLALCGDVRVVSDAPAKIGLTETKIGLVLPTWAIVLVEDAVPAHRRRDVMLLARTFTPQEAAEIGLMDEVVPAESFEERVAELAAELAALPTATFAGTKRRLRAGPYGRAMGLVDDEMAQPFDPQMG